MAASNKPVSHGHLFVGLLSFCMSAANAIMLFITAIVIGLSELLGSFTWSALLVGGLFALIAAAIYFVSIKGPMEQIRARMETIYDVARLFKQAYDWVKDKLDVFVRLRDELWRTE